MTTCHTTLHALVILFVASFLSPVNFLGFFQLVDLQLQYFDLSGQFLVLFSHSFKIMNLLLHSLHFGTHFNILTY